MNVVTQTKELSMYDAILILCLAYRIHGTDAAVRESAHSVRGKVCAEARPVMGKIARLKEPSRWVIRILEDDRL